MNIRYIPTWLGLLLTLYLVTACDRVYDDLSGCLGNTIVFSYLADDNQNIYRNMWMVLMSLFLCQRRSSYRKASSGERTALSPTGGSRFRKGIIKWWP